MLDSYGKYMSVRFCKQVLAITTSPDYDLEEKLCGLSNLPHETFPSVDVEDDPSENISRLLPVQREQ